MHVLTDPTCSNSDRSLNACTLCRKVQQGACLSPTCSSVLGPDAPHCWTRYRAGWDPNYRCGTALSRATSWPLSFSLATNMANCCWVYQTRQKNNRGCANRWQDANLRLFPIHSAPDFANAHYYVHLMGLDSRPKYRIESPMKIWLWMPKSWVLKIATTSGNVDYLSKLILMIRLNRYLRL